MVQAIWADDHMRKAQRRESYAERLINHLGKEKGEGKDKMQENTEEQGLVREDNVSSISDAEVCSSFHLFQHFSSISLEK